MLHQGRCFYQLDLFHLQKKPPELNSNIFRKIYIHQEDFWQFQLSVNSICPRFSHQDDQSDPWLWWLFPRAVWDQMHCRRGHHSFGNLPDVSPSHPCAPGDHFALCLCWTTSMKGMQQFVIFLFIFAVVYIRCCLYSCLLLILHPL